jgi:putative lipoic acid-binding regulatory protein
LTERLADKLTDKLQIEFPCDYPIKIIGERDPASMPDIIAVVRKYAPEVTPDQINTRQSRNGNFESIRVTIVATGEAQLKALHTDLVALPSVRLVL